MSRPVPAVLQDDQVVRGGGGRQHLSRSVPMPGRVFLPQGFDKVWLLSVSSGNPFTLHVMPLVPTAHGQTRKNGLLREDICV